ncbi:MAG: 30S ribosomal protein S6e [Candidatus Bathyarchaeia archaeon]
MAKFKLIISDPRTGKSGVKEIEGTRAVPFIGRKIGELMDGSVAGEAGRRLRITGGTDRDGFPMRADVLGGAKIRVLLSGGVGFKASSEGERRRKTVRGNVITEETIQINLRVEETTAEKPKETP